MENNQLKKRYGLFTAICMVVGIVIGAVVVVGGAGAFVFLKLRKKPQTYVLDESAEETTETDDKND